MTDESKAAKSSILNDPVADRAQIIDGKFVCLTTELEKLSIEHEETKASVEAETAGIIDSIREIRAIEDQLAKGLLSAIPRRQVEQMKSKILDVAARHMSNIIRVRGGIARLDTLRATIRAMER